MSADWVTRLKQCSDESVSLRKWMVRILPESFPEGETTDFSVVFAETKALITKYINLKSLLEK